MESFSGWVIHPSNRYLLQAPRVLVSVLGTGDTAVNVRSVLASRSLYSAYSAKVTQTTNFDLPYQLFYLDKFLNLSVSVSSSIK